jgi:hypothetical protein
MCAAPVRALTGILRLARVKAGLSPALATVQDTSPCSDVWRLCFLAGSTPSEVVALSEPM